MQIISKKFIVILVLILFLCVCFVLIYNSFLEEKINELPISSPIRQINNIFRNNFGSKDIDITLKSEIKGYRISLDNREAFYRLLSETKYVTLPHKNLDSDEVFHVQSIVLTLSKEEQPKFQVYSGKDKRLAFASSYLISGDTLNIKVYVNKADMENRTDQVIDIINRGLTSRILHPLLTSASISARERDQLIEKYVFKVSKSEVPFNIIKI